MTPALLSSDHITRLQRIQTNIVAIINVSNHKKIVQEDILEDFVYNTIDECIESLKKIQGDLE